MSSDNGLVNALIMGAVAGSVFAFGRKTMASEANPADVERAMVEDMGQSMDIIPIGLSGGHQGATYRNAMVGTSDILGNGGNPDSCRPILEDVIFDNAFASGYSRSTSQPYKVERHSPSGIQGSFSHPLGQDSCPPEHTEAIQFFESETFNANMSHMAKKVASKVKPKKNKNKWWRFWRAEDFRTESGEDSTSYSPNPLGSAGIELEEVSAFDEWDTPCCRVCPPGAEGWCEAISQAGNYVPMDGQHLFPFQDRPLLSDPYTLKGANPNQNQSYVDSNGTTKTVSGWMGDYNMNVNSDNGATAVSRNGGETLRLRRI